MTKIYCIIDRKSDFPLFEADSIVELAEMSGRKLNSLYKAFQRVRNNTYKNTNYEIVEIDDEEEDENG